MVTQEQVLDALRAVQDPDLHKDIVTLGFVKEVKIAGGEVDFTVELTTPACPLKDVIEIERERAKKAGKPFDPASVKGPRISYVFQPSGVVIH